MDKFELNFQDYFAEKFVQLPSGKWMHTEGMNETFVCLGNNSPVKEFKERYPEKYKELMDEWFDELHPF